MAEVPNVSEDLKSCYSENEEYTSAIDHLSLNQKSFYDTSDDPLHENCMDKSVSLSTSDMSEASTLTPEENEVVVSTSAHGKVLKKKRLNLSQIITNEDMEAIASDPEEEIIMPESALHTFRSDVTYRYLYDLPDEIVLMDNMQQNIKRDLMGKHLMATSLGFESLKLEVKFAMGIHVWPEDNTDEMAVSLRISKTKLYVCAQGNEEPVVLKELPEIPKYITGKDSNLIFFKYCEGTRAFFRSAAYPESHLATKINSLVHITKEPYSITTFMMYPRCN